jgi:hypothetical protein
LDEFGKIRNQTHAMWEEGPYRFVITRPGQASLALEVYDQRTIEEGNITPSRHWRQLGGEDPLGKKMGRCVFRAEGEEGLRMTLQDGLMQDESFCDNMIWPVMHDAAKVATQWHLQQKALRTASTDQSNARVAPVRHLRGEMTEEELRTRIALSRIDTVSEAPEPDLGDLDMGSPDIDGPSL